MSRKSERLVNLTIALLATKRYLTKSEIFSSVAGYSGDAEAKDRMFERDKEDLRSLGIAIELGTFDPLFEDEAGYRIKPENYSLQLRNLDPLSIALLSKAADMWREAALGNSAQSGLRKLRSLGIESDIDPILELSPNVQTTPEQLPDVIEAISERRTVIFEYLDQELQSNIRAVEPYRISNSRGYWYLIGRDIDKGAIRTFRLDRINSAITLKKGASSFEVDYEALDAEELHSEVEPLIARIAVRKGKGTLLRSGGKITELNHDWDCLEIEYLSGEHLIREVLSVGESAFILEPLDLRQSIITTLQKAVDEYA